MVYINCSKRTQNENKNNDTTPVSFNLNDRSPIALIDNQIVYTYYNEQNSYIFGYYDMSTQHFTDLVCIDNFWISKGIPTIIDNKIYYSLTTTSNERIILEIDSLHDFARVVYTEKGAYALDSMTEIQDSLYSLNMKQTENNTINSKIYKISVQDGTSEIIKESTAQENILAMTGYDDKIYVIVEYVDNTVIEVYDQNGTYIREIIPDNEIQDIISDGIVHFYVFDNYIYLRGYNLDRGVIAQITDDTLSPLITKQKLRYAHGGTINNRKYQVFFMREGNEVYLLDLENQQIHTIILPLNQNESIRGIISDGQKICLSVLDESIEGQYKTKNVKIIYISELYNNIAE